MGKEFNIRDLVQRERHAEIFDWMARSLGKSHEEVARIILVEGIMKNASAYREAHGGGGNSSKDIEGLANRLR